jgi:hypothetical protein
LGEEVGPLAAYVTRGREVAGGNLKVCNTAAAPQAGAALAAQK